MDLNNLSLLAVMLKVDNRISVKPVKWQYRGIGGNAPAVETRYCCILIGEAKDEDIVQTTNSDIHCQEQ